MKVNLILLAAGNSRRFGSNKLLYKVDGKPMYQHMIDMINTLPSELFSKKIIVSQYEDILTDRSLTKEYCMVCNSDSSRGISSSIHLGMEQSEEDVDAWCFMVCDQPYLKAHTVEQLVRNWIKSKKGAACVIHGSETGNPTIFSVKYRKELKDLKGDVGGKRILRGLEKDIYFQRVLNDIELRDLDIMP